MLREVTFQKLTVTSTTEQIDGRDANASALGVGLTLQKKRWKSCSIVLPKTGSISSRAIVDVQTEYVKGQDDIIDGREPRNTKDPKKI